MSERIDNIGFGNLKLLQEPEEFCYGIDAVILADFAFKLAKGKKKTVVDMGTGTGIIPLILSYKTDWEKFIGIELQKNSADRAQRSICLNKLQDRIKILNEDIKEFSLWGKEYIGAVDIIVSNPPYTKGQSGITNQSSAKTIARHETTASLRDFMFAASKLLTNRGDLFMVHRPSRLVDLCEYGRKFSLEPKELCFCSPNKEQKPNIMLIHFVKNGGAELKLMDPLYVYDENGQYTDQIRQCYK